MYLLIPHGFFILTGLANPGENFKVYYGQRSGWCKTNIISLLFFFSVDLEYSSSVMLFMPVINNEICSLKVLSVMILNSYILCEPV